MVGLRGERSWAELFARRESGATWVGRGVENEPSGAERGIGLGRARGSRPVQGGKTRWAGSRGERNGPAGAKLLGRGEREKELGWVGLG